MNLFVNIIAIADHILAFVAIGFTAAFAQAAVRGRHHRLKLLPLWLILAAIPMALIITLVVPSSVRWALSGGLSTGQDGLMRHGVRIWAVVIALLTLATLCVGSWERLRRFGFKRMVQSVGRMLPPLVACLLLAWLMLWMVAPIAGADEGAAPSGVVPEPPALVMMLLFGINATFIGRAIGAKGLDRIAFSLAAIIPTLVSMPATLWLFLHIFGGGQLGWDMARAMVGVSASGEAGGVLLVTWWLVLYLISVTAMGAGMAVGLKRGAAFEHRLERNSLQVVHAASATLAASVGATLADDREARAKPSKPQSDADAQPDGSINGHA